MMTNPVTGLLQHLRHLLALSTNRVLTLSTNRDIADEEITLWRMRVQELPSHKNPLNDLRRAFSVVPWIALLGRKVFAVSATSAAPERTFSSAGNIMTKKTVFEDLGGWNGGRIKMLS